MKIILTLLTGICSVAALAQRDGDLDKTFGTGGIVKTAITNNCTSLGLLLQADGKILAGGRNYNGTSHDFAVLRYKTNGIVDSTFGKNGVALADFNGGDDMLMNIDFQSDNKIVAGGYTQTKAISYHTSICRFKPSGELDSSFGVNGLVIDSAYKNRFTLCLSVQGDDKILTCGRIQDSATFASSMFVARYEKNGNPDLAFGTNGIKVISIQGISDIGVSLKQLANGKILVAGHSDNNSYSEAALVQLKSDGSLDNSFATNGIYTRDFAGAASEFISLTTTGTTIWCTGWADITPGQTSFLVAKFHLNGILDTSFSNDGFLWTDFDQSNALSTAVAVQQDGKVLAGGFVYDGVNYQIALARYTAGGLPDTSFGIQGKLTTAATLEDMQANMLKIQKDGKILVTGYQSAPNNRLNFMLARYVANPKLGINAATIPVSFFKAYPNPFEDKVTLEYMLNDDSQVSLMLTETSGKSVSRLIADERQSAGAHRSVFSIPNVLAHGQYQLVFKVGKYRTSIPVTK